MLRLNGHINPAILYRIMRKEVEKNTYPHEFYHVA